MNIKKEIIIRAYVAFFLIITLSLVVVFKIFQIQYLEKIENKSWKEYAEGRISAERPIPANRGNIYTEDGHLLAASYPEFRLNFDAVAPNNRDFYKNLDSLAISLSAFFGINSPKVNAKKLVAARKQGKRYIKVPLTGRTTYITYPKLQKIKKFPLYRLGQFKGGLIVSQFNRRKKPFGRLAERTIGYVRDTTTAVGLEGYYDQMLGGIDGKRFEQKIASGDWIPVNDDYIVKPQNGKDVITTIDTYVQDIVDNALNKMVKKQGAHHGCAVVMEVKTGKIRAISNIGMRGDSTYYEIFNYAIGEDTEPGSTMKLASIIAAIETGAVRVDDSIDIKNGSIQYYDKVMKDSDNKHKGIISVKKAFEISSNVAISRIIFENFNKTPEKFIACLDRMGLTEMTNVDIKGEPKPYIKEPKDKKNWTGITLPWMSVGYELSLTPLQILTLYNGIANDGVSMKPFLVSSVNDGDKIIEEIQPRVHRHEMCSKSTIKIVKKLLEGVVENGTARNIKSEHFKIAGKTGTAKIARQKQGYTKSYQASFAGYFPADKPIYSCIVVINSPSKGDYYGSSVAAPVFKEIAEKVYARKVVIDQFLAYQEPEQKFRHIPYVKAGKKEDVLSVYKDLKIKHPKHETTEWVKPISPDKTTKIFNNPVYNNIVPNVRDMCLKDALFLLENCGFSVQISGKKKGKVRFQSVRPGRKLELLKNPEIEIIIS